MTERTFDWVSRHDPKSLNYPIREVVGAVEKRRRLWTPGIVLDQGSEGACVGFGWTGELLASPVRDTRRITEEQGNNFAISLYHTAQQKDEWPGENYSGTSVLAGAKTVQEWGFIGSYRWAFGIDDVRDAVIAAGPVVIGIPWLDGMYETNKNYEVKVSGSVVGGHCILLVGYHPSHSHNAGREMFRWRNSWGPSYGQNGSAWIEAGALAELLRDNGEACVPQDRRTVVI